MVIKKRTLADINMLAAVLMVAGLAVPPIVFGPTQEELEKPRIIEHTIQELEELAKDNLEDLDLQKDISERIMELETKDVKVNEDYMIKIEVTVILVIISIMAFFFGIMADHEDLKTDEASFGAKFFTGVGVTFFGIFVCVVIILWLFY